MSRLYSKLSSANPNVLISKLSKPESFKKAIFMIHTKKRSKAIIRGKLGCTSPAAKMKPQHYIIRFLLGGCKALELKVGGERKDSLLDSFLVSNSSASALLNYLSKQKQTKKPHLFSKSPRIEGFPHLLLCLSWHIISQSEETDRSSPESYSLIWMHLGKQLHPIRFACHQNSWQRTLPKIMR